MRHNIREILNAGYSLRRDRAAPVTSAMASVAAVQGRAKVPVINRMTILSGLIKFSDPAPEILDGYSTARARRKRKSRSVNAMKLIRYDRNPRR
jgi:hypothetical protein